MSDGSICEECVYYVYDDDWECYVCEVNIDEDEMSEFLSNSSYKCTYYKHNDEYEIVKKQM